MMRQLPQWFPRHLLRHWRLNLVMLLGLTLTAGLVAGLPALAGALATGNLQETLANTVPAVRNISVSAVEGANLDEGIYQAIQDDLGDLVVRRIQIRQTKIPVDQPVSVHYVHLWFFDNLPGDVRVVDGRLPAYDTPSTPGDAPPTSNLEAAIGKAAAARIGLGVGDVVMATGPQGPIVLEIVGVVEPLDPDDDVWWDDPRTFRIHVKLIGRSIEIITLSMLVPEDTMVARFPQNASSWRILLNSDRITVDNAAAIQQALANRQTQLKDSQVTLASGLPDLLVDFQARFSTARMALFLLSAPALVLILYVLGMTTSLFLETAEQELAVLAARGASQAHMILSLAVGGLSAAILAGALTGPYLALGLLRLWGVWTGSAVAPYLPAESRYTALIAAGLGWMAMSIPVYLATRRAQIPRLRRPAHPEGQPAWQRWYLDLVLLLAAGLVYWQLSQSGSFVVRRIGSTSLTDPFLLLGAAALLIALTLLSVRLWPYLLGLAARLAWRGPGLTGPLNVRHISRAPRGPSRAVLLGTLAVALVLFTHAFATSLRVSQEETAYYLAGADLRVSSIVHPADQAAASIAALPGVRVATPAFRIDLHKTGSDRVHLLAIDPPTFAQVARRPPGSGGPPMASLVQALQQDTLTTTLPAVFSRSLLSSGDAAGEMQFLLAGTPLRFRANALADRFPTLSGEFIVTDWRALAQQVNLDGLGFSGEVWLAADPTQHAALANDPRLGGPLMDDAQAELRHLQSDVLAQGIGGALWLNTVLTGLLGVAGFFLANLAAAHRHRGEIIQLRALGLAPKQFLALLAAEGALEIGCSLLAGTAIGSGLTRLLFPYLSRALSSSLAGGDLAHLAIDWGGVLPLYGALAGAYVLAMVALLLALGRAGLHRSRPEGE